MWTIILPDKQHDVLPIEWLKISRENIAPVSAAIADMAESGQR